MPRDVNGNYSLPAGNPVVPNTIIETDWANPTCNDIAAAITGSLSRAGLGGMLAPFKNADGTIGAPGMTWVNEPASGWYRKSVNNFWYSISGNDIFGITPDGIVLTPGLTASGIAAAIAVQDAEPTLIEGGEWFESDTGNLYMKYQNPDLTFTLVGINTPAFEGVPGPEGPQGDPGPTGPAGPPGPTGDMPTGALIDFAGPLANLPAGYLNCDGAAVNRTTYALLFAAIGTTWGAGDGSTTFNLPSLNRRTTVGSGGSGTGTLGNAVGDTGGAETIALAVADLPSHDHGGATGSENATHTHSGTTGAMSANASHAHNVGVDSGAAGSVAMDTTQFLAANVSGVSNYASNGATVQNTALIVARNTDHTHDVTTGTESANHQHSVAAQGGNTPHNNVQPSAVVLKIIRTGL